jgi:hypothetical protein
LFPLIFGKKPLQSISSISNHHPNCPKNA